MWRELGVIYRRDRHLPRSATTFVEMIRKARGSEAE
jgi:hypothetical protein